MPISELVAVEATLDERFGCPLGEAAALRWGCAGAVFIRSSASHVFVAGPRTGGKRVVLRMRPAAQPGAGPALRRSAQMAAALKNAGAAVAGSVPSLRGALVERVDGYLVTALEAVEGEVLDGDAVDEQSAGTWGRLLADLHARGETVARDDAAPAFATTRASDFPVRLPRSPEVYGLVHGDPEIDNLVWTDTNAAFVDFDDVHYGWYAADVAFALRDWAAPAAAPDLALPIPAAFIDGYQRRRPFTDEERSWLPLLARVSAVATLARLQPVLSEPARDDWPPWAHAVHQRVRTKAQDLRRALA
jgi:Ser/Thr protein kinase RdoA (MazF antagonist)